MNRHPADPSLPGVPLIPADGASLRNDPLGGGRPAPLAPPASSPRLLTDAEIAHRRAYGDWDGECRRLRGKSQKQRWIEDAERLLAEPTIELQPWGKQGLPPFWSEYTETRRGGVLRSVAIRRWRAWPETPRAQSCLWEWLASR